MLATPIPRRRPSVATRDRDLVAVRAAATASGPATEPRCASRRPSAESGFAAAASRATVERVAGGERLERTGLREAGRSPAGSAPIATSVWPISPAAPVAPRNARPSITIPPPIPVPTVIITRQRVARRAPSSCASASAATVASLSTNTGTPRRSSGPCAAARRRAGCSCSSARGRRELDDRGDADADRLRGLAGRHLATWETSWVISASASGAVRRAQQWLAEPPSRIAATDTLVPPTSTPITSRSTATRRKLSAAGSGEVRPGLRLVAAGRRSGRPLRRWSGNQRGGHPARPSWAGSACVYAAA